MHPVTPFFAKHKESGELLFIYEYHCLTKLYTGAEMFAPQTFSLTHDQFDVCPGRFSVILFGRHIADPYLCFPPFIVMDKKGNIFLVVRGIQHKLICVKAMPDPRSQWMLGKSYHRDLGSLEICPYGFRAQIRQGEICKTLS